MISFAPRFIIYISATAGSVSGGIGGLAAATQDHFVANRDNCNTTQAVSAVLGKKTWISRPNALDKAG